MNCKICGNNDTRITYQGQIRHGRVGNYTKQEVSVYKCDKCGTIWHNECNKEFESYYQSEEYRIDIEGTTDIIDFYKIHDKESEEKFSYTGTEIFRDKIVADIGCGGGAFLNYIYSVAKKVIAIEPSLVYQEELKKRGYDTFSYASQALDTYRNGIDVIVSFDCIEHVEKPESFISEAFALLKNGGIALIGTPTDAPVMRELMGGGGYNKFLFSTQHPWVLGKGSFQVMAENCGITEYECRFYQRYGLGNLMYWLTNRAPGKHITYNFISKGLDSLWKAELERQELSDYIVFEFRK